MILTDSTKYRFATADSEASPTGTHRFTGDIMPLRVGEAKKKLSYEDICFLQEASCELLCTLATLNGENYSARDYPAIPRTLLGAEVGRVSFDPAEPMARAHEFGGSFISSSGATPHANQASAYLSNAGQSIDALFPCAMTNSASSLSLVYIGCWLDGSYPDFIKHWNDVFKTLLSLAWSFKMEKRPAGSYAWGLLSSKPNVQSVLSYTGGYFVGRDDAVYNLSFARFVNPAVAVVSQPTTIGDYHVSYNSTTVTASSYSVGSFSVTRASSEDPFGGVNADQFKAGQMLMLGGFGKSAATGFSDFEVVMNQSASAKWNALFAGSSIYSVLTSRVVRADVIDALFELPKMCTKAIIPCIKLYSPSQISRTQDEVSQQWQRDGSGPVQTDGPQESSYGPTSTDYFNEAVGAYVLSVSVYGVYSTVSDPSHQSVEVDCQETHGMTTRPVLRLLRFAADSDQEHLTKGIIGDLDVVILVDVMWAKQDSEMADGTSYSYDYAKDGRTVAVPIHLTRVANPSNANTPEWQSDKSIQEIFSSARSAVSALIPYQFPTYDEIAGGQLQWESYLPPPPGGERYGRNTRNRTLYMAMNGGFGLNGIQRIFGIAAITPRTADQTAN